MGDDLEAFAASYLGHAESERFLAPLVHKKSGAAADCRPFEALTRNPYLLTALIYLYLNAPDRELPGNIGGLFRDLVRLLWKREESRRTAGWAPFEEMQSSFSRLALAIIEEEKPASVSLEYALRFVSNRELLWAGQGANFLIVAGEQVRFYHQHIQDYFAAVALDGSSELDWLQSRGATSRSAPFRYGASVRKAVCRGCGR